MKLDFSNYLLRETVNGTFIGLPCCRMAAYIAQNCRCNVTGKELLPRERELHHVKPVSFGGLDTPDNTVMLNKSVHRLIHSRNKREIADLFESLELSEKHLKMINQYRFDAYNQIIDTSFVCNNYLTACSL